MPPEPRADRLSAVQVGFLVAAVVACRAFAVLACPTYDDAFITYRYARNLAAGDGLVFNPGAEWEPILGTTTLLYSLLMAALARAGVDLVAGALAVNVACDVGIALLLARLLGRRPLVTTALVLGFAALPQIARISVGGMEPPLFALCALSACAALGAGRSALAGLLAAATCLTRPEGALLAAILLFALARRPREVWRYALPVLAIGVVAGATLTAVYGTPVPQSVLAKSAMQGPDPAAEKARRFWTVLEQSFAASRAYLPLLPLVVVGIARAWRGAGPLRHLTLFSLAMTAGYLVARPHTWGWYYYVPLVAWVVWLALGVEAAWDHLARRVRIAAVPRSAAALAPIVLAVLAAATAGVLALRRPTPVVERVYRPLWDWAARTSRAEPGARILASDIGAIGHAWRGTVLDSEGLTWPEALVRRFPLAMIEAHRPEYLMVVAERPRLRHLAERPDVMADYAVIARFSARGETRLDLRPEDVPIEWSQDYLIYRRAR